MLPEPQASAPAPSSRPPALPSELTSDSDTPLPASVPSQLRSADEPPAVSLGIRVKLITLMVTTSFLIVGVLASYFPARQIAEMRLGLRERATMYGRLASLQLRSAIAFKDQQTAREVLGAIAKDPMVDGVALYNENGSRLDDEGKLSELAQSARRGFGEQRTFYLPGRVLLTAPVRSLEGPRGTLVLELSTRSAVDAGNHLIRVALAIGAGALLFGIALAWVIAHSLASRVESIARAASAVARGDLEQRLALDGPQDEIGVLAYGFDAMVRRLRELIRHIHHAAQEENSRLDGLVQQRTAQLDRRNADLRLVLDNVEQGFVTIDRDAKVVGERSRVIEDWVGTLAVGDDIWARLDAAHPGCGASYAVAWSQLVEGVMPGEVSLAQMPQELLVAGKNLRFEYKPLGNDHDFEKLLVVISDATAVVQRNRSEQETQDILDVSSRLLGDRAGFIDFFEETQVLLQRIAKNNSDTVLLKRDLHTVKGNTAIYGLSLVSGLCHDAESELDVAADGNIDCSPILAQWERTCSRIRHLLGERAQHGFEIDEREYLTVLEAVRRGADRSQLEPMVQAWRLEPLRVRLERAAEQLLATVSRLGKGEVEVEVEAPRVYLAREELSEFWGVFAHVVRNAAVHGLELPEARERLGKLGAPRFTLRAGIQRGRLFVEIEDSGPGVDWNTLRLRARARGLPAETDADLRDALFADGVSTEHQAGEMAGRGVGLSAVQAVCARQHGEIEVTAVRGVGTRFRFSWPVAEFRSLVTFDLSVAA